MAFSSGITTVKGISDRRRIPRIGKVRLGIKIQGKSKATGQLTEYPAELPFFLLPDIVAKRYGGNVTVDRAKQLGCDRQAILKFIETNSSRLAEELEIMLPINDMGAVFPHSYRWYGSSRGVKCIGNGERANRMGDDGKSITDIHCPCEKLKSDANPRGECTLRGNLMCLIPKVSMGGVFQIDLGSYNSVVDVNSGIEYVEDLVGRFALVPLILRREPKETHHGGQKQIHWTIKLLLNPELSIEHIEQLRYDTKRILATPKLALPPAEDINPKLDDSTVIDVDPEDDDIQRDILCESVKQFQDSMDQQEFKVIRSRYNPDLSTLSMDDLRDLVKTLEGGKR